MVEIYTDVDGLMTADPKLVPKAKPIDKITFYEIFQMAKNGAKIVHPAAIEFAMKHEMPIVIKNSRLESRGLGKIRKFFITLSKGRQISAFFSCYIGITTL